MKIHYFVLAALLPLHIASADVIPTLYPIYGYSEEYHTCVIKQESATSPVIPNLVGDYDMMGDGLRNCRMAHPDTIFNRGAGILWWMGIVLTSVLWHFCGRALLRDGTWLERRVGWLTDMVIALLILAFLTVWILFFSIPSVEVAYPGYIDSIVAYLFLFSHPAMFAAGAYTVLTILRISWLLIRPRLKSQ